jgi:glycerol-3-phosphate acyltransferase PlsX
MFIGVDGIVVKSHGSSDSYAFANAVGVALNLVEQEINKDITKMLKHMQGQETSSSFVSKIKQKLGL